MSYWWLLLIPLAFLALLWFITGRRERRVDAIDRKQRKFPF